MTDMPVPEMPEEKTRHIEELVQRTKRIILEAVDEILKTRTEPLMEHVKRIMVEAVDDILTKKTEPWLDRGKRLILETIEEVLHRHTDPIIQRVRKLIMETAREAVQVHLPDYSRRVGKRTISYAVAGTLFCLSAIFLFMGGILGLQHAGVPPYATYLAGGAVAGFAALVMVKTRSKAFEKTIAEVKAADRASGE